jgi:hypothetical protein
LVIFTFHRWNSGLVQRRFLLIAVFGGVIADSNNCDIGNSVANHCYVLMA